MLQSTIIQDIVDNNWKLSAVLYDLGIPFYEHYQDTLATACQERSIALETALSSLRHLPNTEKPSPAQLIDCPVDLVIGYLKHAHHTFIKDRLPYFSELISNLTVTSERHQSIAEDLKIIFPIFRKEFIEHMYQEEDEVFHHTLELYKVLQGERPLNDAWFLSNQFSIKEYQRAHLEHDDEMENLTKIVNEYHLYDRQDIHLHVVLEELKGFQKELVQHGRIENEILIPKAREIESKVHDLALREN